MRARLPALVLGLFALLAVTAANAIEAGEQLADPVLEARARAISQDLRCLVCQNQSIDDSDADLARDLRRLVRERLLAGDSNAEVTAFIVARYGDFVLLKPPFKPTTYVLWLGPLAVLAVAGAGVAVFLRRRRDETVAPLSDEERRRLEALLGDERGA